MAANVTTFPLAGPINVLVRLGHGSVTVAARDGLGEATVRLTPRGPASDVLERITVEMDGPTLVVSALRQRGFTDLLAGWRRERDSVDAVIEVPSGTAMNIATGTADVTLTGRSGSTDIATGACEVKLEAVDGDLRLRYGSADTRIGTVSGAARLHGGNGTVHFGSVGSVDCGFGRGEFVADVVRGALRSRAGAGQLRVGAAYGDVDVAFGSGPISIGLPVGVSAKVDVVSGSGEVGSDLPVANAPAPGTRPITVRARTGSGSIRLLQAAAAA